MLNDFHRETKMNYLRNNLLRYNPLTGCIDIHRHTSDLVIQITVLCGLSSKQYVVGICKLPATKNNQHMKKKEDFMQQAIDLAVENVKKDGGPFGAIIVKDGQVVATGVNRVTSRLDPTAHAEINAIRSACAMLGTFDLTGCDIYTSCEPCPMCLGAIYWAHIDRIFYGCSQKDAARAGFDDSFIYNELSLKPEERHKLMKKLLPRKALKAFRAWMEKEDKVKY